MKIAKEIVNELRETLCWESAQPGIAYAIIAAKLEPVKDALANIVKHQDIVMCNMPKGLSVTRQIAADALSLFEATDE